MHQPSISTQHLTSSPFHFYTSFGYQHKISKILLYIYMESIFYGRPQNNYSAARPSGMLGLATSPSVPSSRSILGASLPSEPSIQERRSRLHNKRLDSGSRSSLRNQSSKTLEPIRFQPDICNYGSFEACYDNAWTSIFIIGK